MTGRTPPLRLDIAGLQHNTGADGEGIVRTVLGSELQGWSGPPMSVELGKLVSRRGSALNSLEVPARTVLIPGRVTAPNQELADREYDRYSGELPGEDGECDVVLHQTVPKLLRVRQADTPRVDLPEGFSFRFQLAVMALHPFKRGLEEKELTLSSGASGTLENAGNRAAPVLVEATGSGLVDVASLNGTGGVVGRLRTRVSVAAGTTFDATDWRVRNSAGVQLLRVMQNPSNWLSANRAVNGVPTDTTFHNYGAAPVRLSIFDAYA